MVEQTQTRGAATNMIEARGAPRSSTSGKGVDGAPSSLAATRHDLNNLLMAALAETQLLLLDQVTPETKQSYEFIQEQLRGMRDLIAAMADPA